MPLPFYREVLLPLATPGIVERSPRRLFDPDLVHIATEGPLGWAALRAARRLKLPTVSSYHTNFAEYLACITVESWPRCAGATCAAFTMPRA